MKRNRADSNVDNTAKRSPNLRANSSRARKAKQSPAAKDSTIAPDVSMSTGARGSTNAPSHGRMSMQTRASDFAPRSSRATQAKQQQ